MKSLQETIQDVELKKRQLEENVDNLNEKLVAAATQGRYRRYQGKSSSG